MRNSSFNPFPGTRVHLLICSVIVFLVEFIPFTARADTIPSARYGHAMVTIDTTIYLFGGSTSILMNDRYPAGDLLNDLWAFVDKDQAWQQLEPSGSIPPARHSPAVTVHQGLMYIFGGMGNTSVLNDIWTYDPQTNQWNPAPWTGGYNAPYRYDHISVSTGDYIYLHGGKTSGGNPSSTLWQYNPTTGDGIPLTPAGDTPGSRYGHSAVNLGGNIFIFGGFGGTSDTNYSTHNDIWAFRVSSSLFSLLYPDNTDILVKSLQTALSFGGSMWILGGLAEDSSELNTVFRYDTGYNSWTPQDPLARPRYNAEVSLITHQKDGSAGEVLLFGGIRDNEVISDPEIYVLLPVSVKESGFSGNTSLKQNVPNPFTHSTTIRYELLKPTWIRLTIFDTHGREVALLADGKQTAGTHEVNWNALHHPSGVYCCRLTADGFTETKRMIVVR